MGDDSKYNFWISNCSNSRRQNQLQSFHDFPKEFFLKTIERLLVRRKNEVDLYDLPSLPQAIVLESPL